MRTTPYGRMPIWRSVRAMRQPLRTCVRNCSRAASSPIAEPPPVGGQTGATTEPMTRPRDANFLGQLFELLVGRVDADVRIEQKQIDAVELLAVDLGRGRQVEHRIEIDRRLAAVAFADDAGPGRVVKFGKVVCMHGSLP